MRRFAVVFLLCLAVAGTAVAGFSFAGVLSPQASRDTTNVTVHMGEYYFNLSQTTAPVGTVVFTVTNDGDVGHDFMIPGLASTPIIAKGQTTTLTVNFTKAGSYGYICSVGEHAVYGMNGQFVVTGGTTTSTTTATTTTTTRTAPPPTPRTVPVTLKEFKIGLPSTSKQVPYYKNVKVKVNGKLKTVRKKFFKTVTTPKPLPAGPIHFTVQNVGKIGHNFVIKGAGGTAVLASGASSVFDTTLDPGTYSYECTITGHAALGMKGTLVVK